MPQVRTPIVSSTVGNKLDLVLVGIDIVPAKTPIEIPTTATSTNPWGCDTQWCLSPVCRWLAAACSSSELSESESWRRALLTQQGFLQPGTNFDKPAATRCGPHGT